MTCYFRHLQSVFKKAGIEVTRENRQDVDRLIHSLVRVGYKDCPTTWKEVKKRIAANEEEFASVLREAWKRQTKSAV